MMTDIVTIGDATLYHGDGLEILPTLDKVDATVTDPPYGVELGASKETRAGRGLLKNAYKSYEDTYENFTEIVVPSIKCAVGLAKRAAVFCAGSNFSDLPKPDQMGAVYIKAATGRHSWGFNSLAPIAFYGTAAAMNVRGCRSVVLESSAASKQKGHPCPKPVQWMEWLVDLASVPSEIILDPFMGSGTTGVACVNLGRKFIGIEIERKYFDIACERIDAAYSQMRLFA